MPPLRTERAVIGRGSSLWAVPQRAAPRLRLQLSSSCCTRRSAEREREREKERERERERYTVLKKKKEGNIDKTHRRGERIHSHGADRKTGLTYPRHFLFDICIFKYIYIYPCPREKTPVRLVLLILRTGHAACPGRTREATLAGSATRTRNGAEEDRIDNRNSTREE